MNNKNSIKVILAQPRGFCAGVKRAIEIVEKALKKYGQPIYVKHEIVHNKYVVDDLKTKGAVFVDDLSNIPSGAVTIFSAHGVSAEVEKKANELSLSILDATCPLVKKVHQEAQKHTIDGKKLILIGHDGHPEIEGTRGRATGDVFLVQNIEDVEKLNIAADEKTAYVTQTTLSVDDTEKIITALKFKFPDIEGPDLKDICYATQNRQDAVKKLAKLVDILLVIGSKNSSNSNRLRDLGEIIGIPSYLINNKEDIKSEWLEKVNTIGITAGASAPEILLENILNSLKQKYNVEIKTMEGIEENIKFRLPRELEV